MTGENRLHNRLSRINYSPAVRPVLSSNVTTVVNLAIAPIRLMHIVSIYFPGNFCVLMLILNMEKFLQTTLDLSFETMPEGIDHVTVN